LDVHPSHRIESPAPLQQAADDRPDACTQCHVDKTRAWAVSEHARLFRAAPAPGPLDQAQSGLHSAFSEVESQLFSGDPIQRTLAASALARLVEGREPNQAMRARNRRLSLLLEVMDNDPYPAIRHLALRSTQSLLMGAEQLAGYVPETPHAQRTHALAALRARFSLTTDDALAIQTLHTQAQERAIEIGE
jgi:hypothetical protein